MTTSRENNLDKRQILHAKILSKFGGRLEDFESVVLLSTEFPVEVTCKQHGPYILQPNRALRWRGKGAPYCPDCNRRGPKVGAKYNPSEPTPLTPEQERARSMKSLTSSDRWSRFYKTCDVSLDKWRKHVRQAVKEIEEDSNPTDLYTAVSEQMDIINGWIKDGCPCNYLEFKCKVYVANEVLV